MPCSHYSGFNMWYFCQYTKAHEIGIFSKAAWYAEAPYENASAGCQIKAAGCYLEIQVRGFPLCRDVHIFRPALCSCSYSAHFKVLNSPHLQDTVSKLLSGFFTEDKTRRELDKYRLDRSDFTKTCV